MNTLRLRPVVLYRRATFLPLPYGSENEWKAETSADVSPATLLFFPFRPQPAAGGLADSRGKTYFCAILSINSHRKAI